MIKPGSGLETRLGGARARVKIREQRPQEIKCITKPLIVILDITVSLRPFLVVSVSSARVSNIYQLKNILLSV